MFYLLMTPALCFLISQIIWLNTVRKHDKYLYHFCQLRREAMALLLDSYDDLSHSDAIALRKTIDTLNQMIHYYHDHKRVLFNFRAFAKHVKALQKIDNQKDDEEISNQQVQQLTQLTVKATLDAFLEYTPFLRHEIYAKFFIALASTAANIGFKRAKLYLDDFIRVQQLVSGLRTA